VREKPPRVFNDLGEKAKKPSKRPLLAFSLSHSSSLFLVSDFKFYFISKRTVKQFLLINTKYPIDKKMVFNLNIFFNLKSQLYSYYYN
jgi:hypothetical protein